VRERRLKEDERNNDGTRHGEDLTELGLAILICTIERESESVRTAEGRVGAERGGAQDREEGRGDEGG
jgi:hypothetical protein